MHFSASDAAECGLPGRRDRIIDAHVRDNMRAELKEIQNGTLSQEWIAENDEGRPRFVPWGRPRRTGLSREPAGICGQ